MNFYLPRHGTFQKKLAAVPTVYIYVTLNWLITHKNLLILF